MTQKSTRKVSSELCTEFIQLKSDFSDWRLSKKSQSERIPESLLIRSFGLLNRYKASKVCNELGLNFTDFNHKLSNFDSSSTDINKNQVSDFVEVEMFKTHENISCSLSYTFANGSHLELSLHESSLMTLKTILSELLDKSL